MRLLLVGAGGHARNVFESLIGAGHELAGYVDPRPCAWLPPPRWAGDAEAEGALPDAGIAMGIGGVTPAQLETRLALLDRYCKKGRIAPPIGHPRAVVSPGAEFGAGALIMAGAVVQAGCRIGRGALINTGAVVEHDSVVGEGAHVAPGAIVLGVVEIGPCAMVGAGAVILPGAQVPRATLVKAGCVYPERA
jgi:sugar O-acyltransferase (sialic acid O-acetyltransferase NeuD family)